MDVGESSCAEASSAISSASEMSSEGTDFAAAWSAVTDSAAVSPAQVTFKREAYYPLRDMMKPRTSRVAPAKKQIRPMAWEMRKGPT